ncbi:mucin-6-like, partial [Chiloscyllium plagiosum]|uniref:mucin-6-like n=1 Tax=Chiloscyllium plagiosum TaxID=36176 RepID=UPI001CB8185E
MLRRPFLFEELAANVGTIGLYDINTESWNSYRDFHYLVQALESGVAGDKITMSTFVQEQRLYYSPTKATCTTWGSEHFKTFDNFIFDFASTCNYIFVSDCSGNLGGFNIQIRRGKHGNIKRIYMNIWGTSIIIENANTIVNDNGFVQLPYNLNGVQIKSFGGSTRLVAKQKGFDLVVVWNFIDYLMVELGDEYRNKTCGLCGDFNGHPQLNEFKQGDKVLSPQKFANQYQVDDPSETCHPLDVTNLEESYVDYVSDCSCMLNKVAPLCKLPKKIYVSECQRDLYKCTAKGDTQCSCQTLSEYSRQCSRLLQPVTNWRNISFCPPIPCPGNQVYQECGSPCLSTCSNPQTTCDSYGTYGCFCPEGTVLDDIATKDTCIPLSRCPCVLNGQVYAPGGSVNSPCKSCKCVMGKWDCTNLPCPGRCSIEGGSFVTTFDSRRYRFHGVCTYLLIKSVKMLDSGTIEAVFDKCGVRHSETQLTGIIYATNQGLTIQDGPIPERCSGASAQGTLNEPCVEYGEDGGWEVGFLQPVQKVEMLLGFLGYGTGIEGPGLCGNFDGNSQNDFKSSMGIQEGTASSFVDSWRVIEHCQSAQDIDSHPCSLSQSNSVFAESYCSILMNKSSIFGQCHCRVDPADYYERCKFETCNYEKSQDFMCNSLGVYARACAIKGLILINWRNDVNECKISCHGHQVFSYDSKACNRTCFSLSNSIFECTESGVPVEGCNCPPDTFLDNTNTCVKASSCPCFLRNGAIIPAGKSINIFEQLWSSASAGKKEPYRRPRGMPISLPSTRTRAREATATTTEASFSSTLSTKPLLGSSTRLQILVEHVYPETQCNFRVKTSTVDMIFSLCQLQEKGSEQKMSLYVAFIDLTKAFDLVSKNYLFKVLLKIDCPPKLLSMIESFHMEGIYIRSRSNSRLFDLARLRAKTEVYMSLIREMLFANDATVATHTQQELQSLIDHFSHACKDFGLTTILKKTSVLGQDTEALPVITIDDYELNVVHQFMYLGSAITDNLSLDTEIDKRIGKAASTLAHLTTRIWTNPKLTVNAKISYFILVALFTIIRSALKPDVLLLEMKMLKVQIAKNNTAQDTLIKLTNGHYQITPPNTARGLKVISNPLYLKFDLKISSILELTIIWNRNMNAYISITRLSEFAVCGLCGNYNGNADDEYITQNKYLVSNVLTFANSWKEDPTCRDVTEVVFPCHKNPYRLARAEKMCAIINNKVFEPCHKLVYRMPYYDNCVRDACGCELAGDCECLCDAVAVYAKACIDAGVCIDWRTPDFCPVYCDYFNYHKGYSIVDE